MNQSRKLEEVSNFRSGKQTVAVPSFRAIMDLEPKNDQRHQACVESGVFLWVCAILSVISSPVIYVFVLPRSFRVFYQYIYINWSISLLLAPLSLLLLVRLFNNSRNSGGKFWWAYLAGVLSLLISCSSLILRCLMIRIPIDFRAQFGARSVALAGKACHTVSHCKEAHNECGLEEPRRC